MAEPVTTSVPEDPKATQIDEPERPSDEDILKYERTIKESANGESKPISDLIGLQGLQKEYETGLDVFKRKIEYLTRKSRGLRLAKRDGNCFYRAVSYRLCELLVLHPSAPWTAALLARAQSTKAVLTEMGYDMELLVDFWEVFENALQVRSGENVNKTEEEARKELLEMFQTDYISDTIVCYLRLVTAAILKKNRDLFEAFILDSYPSLDLFISTQVEPMNIEADHPHIVAIAQAIGITIRIANLDPTPTSADEGVNYHVMDPMEPLEGGFSAPDIVLLYRPGHYDVLYIK